MSVGEQVTFRISGTNRRATTATAMTLADLGPGVFDYVVRHPPAASATSSGQATFTFGATAPGATREATITLVALAEAVSRNDLVVVATDAGGDTAVATDDEPVTVTDLAVGATKTLAAGEDAYVSVGEQVTFRISGTNSLTTATAMSACRHLGPGGVRLRRPARRPRPPHPLARPPSPSAPRLPAPRVRPPSRSSRWRGRQPKRLVVSRHRRRRRHRCRHRRRARDRDRSRGGRHEDARGRRGRLRVGRRAGHLPHLGHQLVFDHRDGDDALPIPGTRRGSTTSSGTPAASATSSGEATFTFGATAPGATREATITLVALAEGVTPKRPASSSPPTPAATPLSPPTTSP